MRSPRLVGLIAGLAMVAAVTTAPVHAQTNVEVTLATGAGTRTLYVENMIGAELTSLDFGAARSLPFRVRVVDSEFARQGFSVSATMTHMYYDDGTLDYTDKIASSDLSLGSQLAPLNVLNVEATVQPLVNTVSSITDGAICTVLGLAMSGGACQLTTSNLVGKVQTVQVPVDLDLLGNLPLLPQQNELGAFTNAEYGTGTVGFDDPAKGGEPAATPRRLLAGSRVDTSAVLTGLSGLLATTPLATLVPAEAVVQGLQAQLPLVWGLLSPAQIDAIILSTTGSVVPLTLAEVVAQSGTYMSLPTLDVDVPTDATPGDYRGTLVVTALQ